MKGVNGKIHQKFSGSLKGYKRIFDRYLESGCKFTTISYGETRKLVRGKRSYNYYGIDKEGGLEKLTHGYLCTMVQRDIDAYIAKCVEEGKELPKPFKKGEKKPLLQYINTSNIYNYGFHKKVTTIDINHCHWRTIYNLGFITEKTYKKGLKSDALKVPRLVAIGVLNKLMTVREYDKGKLISEKVDKETYKRYSPFYWAVISKVWETMYEIYKELEGDLYMYLTDCAFINPEAKDEVEAILAKNGYGYKELDIVFTGIKDNKIYWLRADGKTKSIRHTGEKRPSDELKKHGL